MPGPSFGPKVHGTPALIVGWKHSSGPVVHLALAQDAGLLELEARVENTF